MDATLSLLRFVATSGNKGSRSDFEEYRMAVTGGLKMPEGQLEVAGANVIRARRSKTVVEERNVIDSVVRHAIEGELQVLLQSKIWERTICLGTCLTYVADLAGGEVWLKRPYIPTNPCVWPRQSPDPFRIEHV
jgi:hypothetical protein